MSDPTWKKLVDDLRGKGITSPYLDRLRERLQSLHIGTDIEVEIVQEMASALGRAEDKVNVALLKLDLAGREIDAAKSERSNQSRLLQLVDAFNRQREVALTVRRELLIHREALGFRRNHALEEIYPIPSKRSVESD